MQDKFIKDVNETKTFRREISKVEIFVTGQMRFLFGLMTLICLKRI